MGVGKCVLGGSHRARKLAVAAGAVLLLARPGWGQVTTNWQAGIGNWFTAANWDNRVPQTVNLSIGDTANINNGGTAQIASGAASAGSVNVGGSVGQGGSVALSGGTLVAGSEFIVTNSSGGTAAFSQTAGTNTVGNLYMQSAGSDYLLSGGVLQDQNAEYISGTFNQAGGTNTGSALGGIGVNTGGSYLLSGGTIGAKQSSSVEAIEGNGSFTQSGGTNIASLYVGTDEFRGQAASYLLSAGLLTSVQEDIGHLDSGSGTFTQTGGTNQISLGLQIGEGGGNGTYNMLGGTLSAGYIVVTDNNRPSAGRLFIANSTVTATSPAAFPPPLGLLLNATVSNRGLISLAGPSGTNVAGDLNVVGPYAQSSTGELDVSLGGLKPGTQYPVLAVDGTATLAGTLGFSLANNFMPEIGQTFSIITSTSLTGSFATVNDPSGVAFDVAYASTGVTLTVTALPEPTSMSLLALTGIGLLKRHRSLKLR